MNEEANLPRTLESVKWADEIIVVDSGSRDRTIEIAKSFGAKTSYHAFGGHGEQKNVALDLCTSDWILLLDADEVLTPELQQEIRNLLAGRAEVRCLLDSAAESVFRQVDSARRVLSGPQAAAVQARRGTAERRSRTALHAPICRAAGQAARRHAALCLSHDGHLSRAHEPLQLRDCTTAAQARQGQPGFACVYLECGAEPGGDVSSTTTFFGWDFWMGAKD